MFKYLFGYLAAKICLKTLLVEKDTYQTVRHSEEKFETNWWTPIQMNQDEQQNKKNRKRKCLVVPMSKHFHSVVGHTWLYNMHELVHTKLKEIIYLLMQ